MQLRQSAAARFATDVSTLDERTVPAIAETADLETLPLELQIGFCTPRSRYLLVSINPFQRDRRSSVLLPGDCFVYLKPKKPYKPYKP